jgi:osmotically-inducible protein OsmY
MIERRAGQPWKKAVLMAAWMASCAVTLQGCALAVVGAAAGGGAMVVSDRRTLGAQTEDREIQVKALAQMHDNLPDGSHVNVVVFNRRALITGEVPDAPTKQRVEDIVRGLNNVNSIVDELAVMPAASLSSRAGDSYLEGRVKSELIATKGISANYFKVVCERDTVYLMGLVTREEGDIAASAAASVPDVVQVVKLFEYIQPDAGTGTSAAAAAPAPAPAVPAAVPDTGATVGAPIDSSSVTSRPLQASAPISSPSVPGAGQ